VAKFRQGARAPENEYIVFQPRRWPNTVQFGWPPVNNVAAVLVTKPITRNPLMFAGVPQTGQQMSVASGPKFAILCGHVKEILLFNKFFPIVEDSARQSCAIVRRWRFFASCISSEPRAAHFRSASCILNSH